MQISDESVEYATIDALPDNLLAHCLTFLDERSLAHTELACWRFKRTVEKERVWVVLAERAFPPLAPLLRDIDASDLAQLPQYRRGREGEGEGVLAERRQSAACKRLQASLAAAAAGSEEISLLADAPFATSTDHPEEQLKNVLSPTVRSNHTQHYWSSAGAEEEGSTESAMFVLAHPLCMVHEVAIRPFKAWFQLGQPVYAPQKIKVRLGRVGCYSEENENVFESRSSAAAAHAELLFRERDDSGSVQSGGRGGEGGRCWGNWAWSSEESPVGPADELQSVCLSLPPSALGAGPLCVGGHLQIDLIGRTQRQEADGLFYTCLGYVKAMGRPIYHFSFATPPVAGEPRDESLEAALYPDKWPARLKVHYVDPLVQRGGLFAVAEGGRRAVEGEDAQPPQLAFDGFHAGDDSEDEGSSDSDSEMEDEEDELME